jgi:hypothetical protein
VYPSVLVLPQVEVLLMTLLVPSEAMAGVD